MLSFSCSSVVRWPSAALAPGYVSVLLRAAEKRGLLTLKTSKGDVAVAGVNTAGEEVGMHVVYRSVGDEEARRAKREAREGKEREEREKAGRGVGVVELWRAHTSGTRALLEEVGKE